MSGVSRSWFCTLAFQFFENQAPVQRPPAVETNLERVPHQVTFTDRPGAGVSDNRPSDVAAGVERERCEGAQFSPSERLVAFTPELCLDRPVFPVPVESYQVNAFVGMWKFKQFTVPSGHLAQRPDVSEDGSVFRLGLEIELNETLERPTYLGFGDPSRPLPEILPGRTGGNKAVYAIH
jgi:hypothetical protein